MSSILDALKKADREAAADRTKGTPWSSPIPPQTSNRTRRMRLWVSIGLGVGLSLAVLLFFNTRNPETRHPEATVKTAPDFQQDREALPQRSALPPKPALPISQLPRKVAVNDTAKLPEQRSRTEMPGPNPPIMEAAPHRTQTANESSSASIQPLLPESKPQPVRQPVSDPVVTIEALPTPSPTPDPTMTEALSDLNEIPPAVEKKNYKSDQRIELQALVWAPEPAGRFVVINNHLIREGGSIDNIVVEEINPDDVRLADGNDRWYEKFKVR